MGIRVDRWNDKEAPNLTELRRRLEAEGYSVTEHNEAPGTAHEPHDHATDQSLWIISGSVQLWVSDETYTLNAGDRDYLPAQTQHSALTIGDEPVVYLNGVKR